MGILFYSRGYVCGLLPILLLSTKLLFFTLDFVKKKVLLGYVSIVLVSDIVMTTGCDSRCVMVAV